MACCIIGVGFDSAVLCAVEPITDYCYRSGSDCSQGTNGCEDWGNSRNIDLCWCIPNRRIGKSVCTMHHTKLMQNARGQLNLATCLQSLPRLWLCLKLWSLQQKARNQKMHFK